MIRSHQGIIHQSFTKWNSKSIHDNFLLSDDIVRQIDEIIQQIESHDMSQQELDSVKDTIIAKMCKGQLFSVLRIYLSMCDRN